MTSWAASLLIVITGWMLALTLICDLYLRFLLLLHCSTAPVTPSHSLTRCRALHQAFLNSGVLRLIYRETFLQWNKIEIMNHLQFERFPPGSVWKLCPCRKLCNIGGMSPPGHHVTPQFSVLTHFCVLNQTVRIRPRPRPRPWAQPNCCCYKISKNH